jgi:hypothetical protein
LNQTDSTKKRSFLPEWHKAFTIFHQISPDLPDLPDFNPEASAGINMF